MVVKSIQVRPVDYETDLRVSGSRLSLFYSRREGGRPVQRGAKAGKKSKKSQRGVLTCPITPPIMVATGHAPDRFSLETKQKKGWPCWFNRSIYWLSRDLRDSKSMDWQLWFMDGRCIVNRRLDRTQKCIRRFIGFESKSHRGDLVMNIFLQLEIDASVTIKVIVLLLVDCLVQQKLKKKRAGTVTMTWWHQMRVEFQPKDPFSTFCARRKGWQPKMSKIRFNCSFGQRWKELSFNRSPFSALVLPGHCCTPATR